jgi:CheY-like chemotaxis protein
VKQGIQILVVDDEVAVRRSMKMMLEHAGHQVSQANCGEAALEQFARRNFDLVITDFSMPGMPGDQLVAQIRQLAPAQPIIMATAFAEDYKLFGRPGGNVDALILKPFTFKELLDAVAEVLSRRQVGQSGVGLPYAGDRPPPSSLRRALPE